METQFSHVFTQTNKKPRKMRQPTTTQHEDQGCFASVFQNGDLGRAGAQKGLQVLLASHKERPAAGTSWNSNGT